MSARPATWTRARAPSAPANIRRSPRTRTWNQALPVYVILHGQKGMPPVGSMMSDDQVAAVVNYVRTNFGNDYKDPVTAEDVAGAR